MLTDIERMREQIRKEVKEQMEQERADKETQQRIRDIFRPYAKRGLTFGQGVGIEHCPASLHDTYESVLQETAAERRAEEDQKEQELSEAFLKGFRHDPW